MHDGDHNELVMNGDADPESGGAEIRGRGASPGAAAPIAPQGGRSRGGGAALLIRGPAQGPGAREGCTSDDGTEAIPERQPQGQTYGTLEATQVRRRISSKRHGLAAPHIVSTDGNTKHGASPPPPKSKEDYKIHLAAVDLHGSSCTLDPIIASSVGCTVLDGARLGEGRASGSDAMEEVGDARSHAAAAWAWHGRDSRSMAGAVTRPSESAF